MPRTGQPLPKAWLSAAQVETVLAQPKLDGRRPCANLRNRAILETLYSTGLRRKELVQLATRDVDFAGGALTVRKGKGNKDRVIPIGERALAWIQKYLETARPALARDGNAPELFLSERGKPLSVGRLTTMVTHYLVRAGFAKSGSCHVFRHTCATLMLDGGADIRYVQEQLGHACLQTTQIYAHVSIRRLKEYENTRKGIRKYPRLRFLDFHIS